MIEVWLGNDNLARGRHQREYAGEAGIDGIRCSTALVEPHRSWANAVWPQSSQGRIGSPLVRLDDVQRRAYGLRPRSRRHGIVTRASSRLASSTTAILAASPSVLCVQR